MDIKRYWEPVFEPDHSKSLEQFVDDIDNAMEAIRELLEPYDFYIDSAVGSSQADSLASEMGIILAVAAVIIVLVLLLTSRSYAEIPVLLLTFIAAAVQSRANLVTVYGSLPASRIAASLASLTFFTSNASSSSRAASGMLFSFSLIFSVSILS